MTHERSGGPWPGATYNGFSDGGPTRPHAPPRVPPRRSFSRGALYGGLAAAIAAGVLFGVFARPELGARPETRPSAVATPTVPVEVAPVTPAPPPVATDRLEVLPPETASTARYLPPAPPALPAERIDTPAPRAPVIPPPRTETPQLVMEAPEAPIVRPSFNCRNARTPAEEMVCADPRLARLDQRLDRAFRRAASSGAPYRELREDQDDWLRIREDAARYSPDAVANIYRQRIDELDDIAGPE